MEQVKRIASALVLLPPLVFFLLHASPVLFLILVLIVIGLSLREYFHILQHVHLSPCTYVTWLAAFALPIMAHLGDARWLSITLFLSMVALTISVMLTAAHAAHFFPMLVYSVFGVLFIGWTLSHLILLRLLPAGPWYMLFLCVVVWVGDTAAMYVGKSLGLSQNGSSNQPRQDLGGRYRLCHWRCVHSRGECRILAATFGTLATYRAGALYFSRSPVKRFG